MEVEGQSPPRAGSEELEPRSSRKPKRAREVEVFQRVVESAGESRVQKRERSEIRRAPSAPLNEGEKAFCRTFLKFLHEQKTLELERLVSDPQVSQSVALHLLQASGMERAGLGVLQGLVAACQGDSCRIARYLAKWGEASPEMFSVLISMGPEEVQKEVAREVMSCLGQRGGLPKAEALFQALPEHLRPNFEEVRQHLLDVEQLSHQLGGLQLGLPGRGDGLM